VASVINCNYGEKMGFGNSCHFCFGNFSCALSED
jgi:hypothetical protein